MTSAAAADPLAGPAPGQLPTSARAAVDALAARHPDTVQLAESASVAVQVEPALLRRLRVVLHRRMPPGVEADLWFSPLVRSGNHSGFELHSDVRLALLERLAERPADLLASWNIVERMHRPAAPTQRLEEALTVAVLRGDADREAGEHLLAVATTMTEQPARSLPLARWAAAAMTRIPPAVWQVPEASLLAMLVSARLDGRRVLPLGHRPLGVEGWARLLRPSAPAAVLRVGLRWIDDGLELSEPPAAGAQLLTVPVSDPVLLHVTSLDSTGGGHWLALDRGATQRFSVPEGELVVATTDGARWRIGRAKLRPQPHRPLDLIEARHRPTAQGLLRTAAVADPLKNITAADVTNADVTWPAR
ncbi:hypothetical protein GCM10009827_097150 [Dactylosporangium maewongense]|uniref:Uncharacterized protein n=1 Tax=Dactylosporangium maewongense TaxID=634393 RepID=A0ABP4NEC4_9ACTN